MATIGPLLTRTMARMASLQGPDVGALAAHVGGDVRGALPLYLQTGRLIPYARETWQQYRQRVASELAPLQDRVRKSTGLDTERLISGNSLQVTASPPQVARLANIPGLEFVELDPLVDLTLMDDAIVDVDLAGYTAAHAGLDGAGVRVAVLDSGIDLSHPYLKVVYSKSTVAESDLIPGNHGTHCAGSIASRDATYPGVAPGVDLYNIKVLDSLGRGSSASIVKGIDEALNQDVHVLSMSLGFNHLPTWWTRGHGWSCTMGRCPLCTAVDNASSFENRVCVVAAGNEHARAEALRAAGHAGSFDTELGCPGQAREAITVGALHKRTFLLADFSSRGPTAYGASKPTLVAPGVNVTSTVPIPRTPAGSPMLSPPRSVLFGRDSGTSMATPIVAGAAALAVQQYVTSGTPWTPAMILRDLVMRGVQLMPPLSANEVGAGRLLLTHL